VIWDNIDKYFGIDPELVNQVVSYGQSRFVAATNSMAILPPGVPVTAINKEFIAYNPNLTKLYNELEIEILNWATYFRRYVIPGFGKLSSDQKFALMNFVGLITR
jgi:hypothetical protein